MMNNISVDSKSTRVGELDISAEWARTSTSARANPSGNSLKHNSILQQQMLMRRRVTLKKSSLATSLVNHGSRSRPSTQAPSETPSSGHSVYINPNFLTKVNVSQENAVHINPHFFKKAKTSEQDTTMLMCKSVHINPRLLSSASSGIVSHDNGGVRHKGLQALSTENLRVNRLNTSPVEQVVRKQIQFYSPLSETRYPTMILEKRVQNNEAFVSMGKKQESSLCEKEVTKIVPVNCVRKVVQPNKIDKPSSNIPKVINISAASSVTKLLQDRASVPIATKRMFDTLEVGNNLRTCGPRTLTEKLILREPTSKGLKVTSVTSAMKRVTSSSSIKTFSRSSSKSLLSPIAKTTSSSIPNYALVPSETKLPPTSFAKSPLLSPISNVPSSVSSAKRLSLSTPELWRKSTPPVRPPSSKRKYLFRSKTKLVKASVGISTPVASQARRVMAGTRVVRFTPHGSTLLAVSRTKLVRLPGRGRKINVLRTEAETTTTPETKASVKCISKSFQSPTPFSVTRMKTLQLPGKVRRSSTSKTDAPLPSASSTPFAAFTKTRFRLRRASVSGVVQSPVVRLARKVCSKYKYRSAIAVATALNKNRPSVTVSRQTQGPWCESKGSRYKVDHRNVSASSSRATGSKVCAHLLLSPLKRSVLKNGFGNGTWTPTLLSPKVALSHRRLARIGNNPGSRNYLQNSALVRIGGLLYKSSRNKLILSKTSDKTCSAKPRTVVKRRASVGGHVVYVHGDKFVMDRSGKTLQRVAHNLGSVALTSTQNKKRRSIRRVDIGGVTYVQKSPNVLVMTNTHKARNVLSNAKQKSIAFLTKKMRKINTPCLFYRRFGRCPRQEKGRCELVHDPKYIDVCKKFLQGKCTLEGCLLSHNIGPEKMPTCRFFLEACCVRDNCPYLHVKVNDRAPICRNFLQGFCADGPECLKRHVSLCPEFDEKGSCSKGKYCPYPHSTAQRNPRATCSDLPITLHMAEEEVSDTETGNSLLQKRKRYYETDSAQDTLEENNTDEKVVENVTENNESYFAVSKRQKIGDLPSFIALE